MTAEKYLQSIRDMQAEIICLKREREDIANDIGYINSSAPNVDRVQTSTKGDALEMTALRHIDRLKKLDKRIHNRILEYNAKKINLIVLLHRLPDDQRRRFLIDYYYKGKGENEIATEYHYANERSIYGLKRRSVKLFENNFAKDVRKFDRDIIQKLKKNEKKQNQKSAQI